VRKTAIVIGSGAGGSMTARVLAKSGQFDTVTVLEKGPNYFQNLDSPNFSDVVTFFSNDEIKFGTRTGPQTSSDSLGNADPLLDPRRFINPNDPIFGPVNTVGEVNSLPQIVGGGLNHADWKARRLRPADFKLKTLAETFGYDISGANVVDWPLSYNDLEPFYTLSEYIIGVQGPAQLPGPFVPRRRRPYPMPPGVPQYVALVLAAGATAVGLHPFPAPMGATSRPYNGRPVCNDCGFDGGFGCPIGAKSSPGITALRDALLTGKVQLVPQSYVYRLNLDGHRVASVSFFDSEGNTQELSADVFVVASSAIESARLCLLSGLSNPNIGRNLMFHYQTQAAGIFLPGRLHPHRGRAVTHMFDDFAGPANPDDYVNFNAVNFNPAASGTAPRGGTVELAGGQPLISEAKLYFQALVLQEFAPLLEEFGLSVTSKNLTRLSPLRDHLAALTLQGEDLPQVSNMADLDPELKDVFGIPVARITYHNHSYEIEASNFYQPIMAGLIGAAGGQVVFVGPATKRTGGVPTSAHIMGTLRMGTDPATSVTDPGGKFHGIDNLYAADGSLFPTSGGMNPSLTICALAYRVGASIVNPDHPLEVAEQIDPTLL
jgi:choline dehydrogenase-like flavoprotein